LKRYYFFQNLDLFLYFKCGDINSENNECIK
jgi:hypothetical protein